MDKILFLDIDGVLNNEVTKERFQHFTGISVKLAKKLTDWLAKYPEVSVVLSSTWRKEEDFRNEVKRNGVDFIACTPDFYGRLRGLELEAYLKDYSNIKYAILDDYNASMFLAAQRPFLVQTSYVHGLRDKDLKKLEKLLELKDDSSG